eukprot:7158224-Pyramimonas_sp.AAC.1
MEGGEMDCSEHSEGGGDHTVRGTGAQALAMVEPLSDPIQIQPPHGQQSPTISGPDQDLTPVESRTPPAAPH